MIHGQNEGCFLQTLNIGCACILGAIGLFILLMIIGTCASHTG